MNAFQDVKKSINKAMEVVTDFRKDPEKRITYPGFKAVMAMRKFIIDSSVPADVEKGQHSLAQKNKFSKTRSLKITKEELEMIETKMKPDLCDKIRTIADAKVVDVFEIGVACLPVFCQPNGLIVYR